MNERLETDLLAIIKEGQNLTEGYVEIKPGIRIKAGREREFERLCDNYYEQEFNQIIENDTDTITPVYNSLTKLVATENEEYYMSKASDYVLETKNALERYKALIKSLNTVNRSYSFTTSDLNDLYLKRENTPEWHQKVEELNGEVRRLTENSAILTNQILEIRKKVNETLIRYAEEQMQALRENFTHTTRNADQAATMDHNIILASDVKEYDSLYRLVLILKQANTIEDFEKLEVLNNAMFVTEDQRAVLNNSILPNIKFFTYVREDGKYIKANNEFIAELREAMERLKLRKGNFLTNNGKDANNGLYLTKEAQEEYNRYLEILKVLHKANDDTTDLKEVWGKIYVSREDENKILRLLNDSKYLKMLNPDIKKRDENNKLIEELYAYLDELANKVTSYTGVANLPIKSTKTVGDKAWVVADNDWEEACRIIDIIKLLQAQTDNLTPVWGIANVSKEYVSRFKSLANATKKFSNKIPNIPENDAEIENIRSDVKELFKKVRDAENPILADDGKVLASDAELYKLLQEKYSYLEAAKASDNLVPTNGVLIDNNHVKKYEEIVAKIDALKKEKEAKIDLVEPEIVVPTQAKDVSHKENIPIIEVEPVNDFAKNDAELVNLKERLATLRAKSSHNELERKMFDLLSEQIEILEAAKKSDNVIEAGSLKFANETDKNKYLVNLTSLNDIYRQLDLAEITSGVYAKPEELAQDNSQNNTLSANDSKIAELKEEMAKLEPNLQKDELADEIYNHLNTQVEMLENAKNSESTTDMNGLKFASEADKEKYLTAQVNLDEITNKLQNPTKEDKKELKKKKHRKRILGFRMLKVKAAMFFKNNLKEIIAGGLGLASIIGLSFLPGVGEINFTKNALQAIQNLLVALGKIGVFGIGSASIIASIKKIINKAYEDRLPLPDIPKEDKKEEIEEAEVKEEKTKTMSSVITQTDLINAQVDYEANRINKDGQGLTEEEIIKQIEEMEAKGINPESLQEPKKMSAEEEKTLEEQKAAERFKKGQEIIEKQRKAKEQLEAERKEREAREKAEEAETLARVEQRAESFKGTSGSVIYSAIDDDIPSMEELEAARELNAQEAEQEATASKPVVAVPSQDEIIKQLGASEGGERDLSPEEIEALLANMPSRQVTQEPEVLDVQPSDPQNTAKTARVMNLINAGVDTSKTGEVMDKIVGSSEEIDTLEDLGLTPEEEEELKGLREQARQCQHILDTTSSEFYKTTYQNALKTTNEKIEALLSKGKSR